MGVRLLIGEADGPTTHAAAMYCSTSGWMIGPIWEGEYAEETVEAFLEWLRKLSFASLTDEIGLVTTDLPTLGKDGDDPRHWPDSGLDKVIVYFRRTFVDADGTFREQV